MEKTNQRESVSCYARNRNHYIKWCLIYGLIMSFTFPPGVAMLFYAQLFNWVSWVLTLVGALCLYKLVTGLLSIFNPDNGKLGRSVKRYSDGTIHTDVAFIFGEIEKDIHEHGKKFGCFWIGKEWALGEEAMRVEFIRGIFSFKIWKGKRYEYAICLVDEQENVQVTNLTREKELDALYDYLRERIPGAASGNFEDYTAFIGKDDAQREAFEQKFEAVKREGSKTFVFKDVDDMPTSHVTTELIRERMNTMEPGQRFILTPCLPIAFERGKCTYLSCHRVEAAGQFVLLLYYENTKGNPEIYALRFIPLLKARNILTDFFENKVVPDMTGWEDQSHLLRQERPLEDYVLYVDEHKYDHIDFGDVQASWENLNEGKCDRLLLRTPGWQNGYLEVAGTKDNYTVEVAGFDSNHQVHGFRTRTPYGGHVVHWLHEYYHHYKYPEIRDGWEDITEEVLAREKKG